MFKDWDGTIVKTIYLNEFDIPSEKIDFESIKPEVNREPTEEWTYTFLGWDGDKVSPIYQLREFSAIYSQEKRSYTIRWFKNKGDKNHILEKTCLYGEEVIFEDVNNNLSPVYNNGIYSLFTGWDKSTGFITGDLNVYGKWSIGSGPYPEDGKDWTAAQIYTIAKQDMIKNYFAVKNQDGSVSNTPNGDRIGIQLGRDFNFDNINKHNLIEEPVLLNSSKPYIEIGSDLLKDNENWTLVFDAYLDGSVSTTTLFSCLDAFGLGIQMSYTYQKPKITWKGSWKDLKNIDSRREVFVLRHRKDTKIIEIFQGCLEDDTPSKTNIQHSSNELSNSTKFIIGSSNNSYSGFNYIIHRCTLWDGLLSNSECMELASWPYETANFDIVSFGSYLKEDMTSTKIDFFASQLTWTDIRNYKSERQEQEILSFYNSPMKTWLEQRFYNSLPLDWKSIITKTIVPMTEVNLDTGEQSISRQKSTLFWLPAYVELTSTDAEPLVSEGTRKSAYTEVQNKVFIPGVSTVDVYSKLADWYIESNVQPEGEFENGSMWCNTSGQYSTTYWIYYYGLWIRTKNYWLRSSGDSSYPFRYMGNTGTPVSTASGTNGILPCFSL